MSLAFDKEHNMQGATLERYQPPSDPNWDFWPLVGARGDGKTYSALKAIGLSDSDGIIVASNVDHARWCGERILEQQPDAGIVMNRTQRTVRFRDGRVIVFCSQSDFGDTSWLRGRRFRTALLDELGLYRNRADNIAGELRRTCRVERIITTSGVW